MRIFFHIRTHGRTFLASAGIAYPSALCARSFTATGEFSNGIIRELPPEIFDTSSYVLAPFKWRVFVVLCHGAAAAYVFGTLPSPNCNSAMEQNLVHQPSRQGVTW